MTSNATLTIAGFDVAVLRKPIGNIHITVHPPNGDVRVSAPTGTTDEAVRLAVVERLDWIRKHQRSFTKFERTPTREMVSGESILFSGRRYRLQVRPCKSASKVEVVNGTTLVLYANERVSEEGRRVVLDRFYRQHLANLLPELVARYANLVGVEEPAWRIRRMHTRWGTANPKAGAITLNLELAKHETRSVDYVVAHEVAHLIDRTHSAQFQAVLSRILPDWQHRQAELQTAPGPLRCGRTP